MPVLMTAQQAIRLEFQERFSGKKQQHQPQRPKKKIHFAEETAANEDTEMTGTAGASNELTQGDPSTPTSPSETQLPLDTSELSFLAEVAVDPDQHRAARALMQLKQEDSLPEKESSIVDRNTQERGSKVTPPKLKGKGKNAKRRWDGDGRLLTRHVVML